MRYDDNATLRYAVGPTEPIMLSYSRADIGLSQARFRNRYALCPQIDLSAYKCRAVIDWLDIELQTTQPTQHQWIQRSLVPLTNRKPYVEALNVGPGNASRSFRVRFQEPHIRDVLHCVEKLKGKFALVGEIRVTGLEVSVDFTPREPSDEKRAIMLGTLFRHFLPTRNVMASYLDLPRFAYSSGKGVRHLFSAKKGALPDANALMAWNNDLEAPVDACLYMGAKNSSPMWRIMDKVVDTQNRNAGTYVSLNEDKERSRIEVTLNAATLEREGIRFLSDLVNFNFAPFQRNYFRFLLPSFKEFPASPSSASMAVQRELEAWRKKKFLMTGAVGLEAMDIAASQFQKTHRKDLIRFLKCHGRAIPMRNRTGGGDRGTMASYEQMTRRVHMALAKLTEREAIEGQD